MEPVPKSRTPSVLFFAALLALTAAIFRDQLAEAMTLPWKDDRYISIAAAPLLCLFLLYWERATIFPQARFSPSLGSLLTGTSMLLGVLLSHLPGHGNSDLRLALVMLSIVLVWISGFILWYGVRSFRSASFALCCLFLMIPISPVAMGWMTAQLQHGSAAVSLQVLRLWGIPVFREGMTFMLPGLVFEVAPECSGLHSWVAFFIAALLATRLFLRSRWTSLALVALTVPLAILKNALRIVIIASLTAYVDRSIIYSPLHRHGGPLFALIDLVIFVPLIMAARRMENRRGLTADSGGERHREETRDDNAASQMAPVR